MMVVRWAVTEPAIRINLILVQDLFCLDSRQTPGAPEELPAGSSR
jgi:hypothetical protein